ncbi:MAG: MBL fold metallo-hydrolase [Actinobacteria bacterium]|nr:MBL fold metallo-hydrolase [Actinomycetota bacterium]
MRRVTWLGHATVLLELDGTRLLTDPLLRAHVAHLRRHAPLVTVAPVDAVLISHAHHDHLDRPSLRTLARAETAAVAPRGTGALLRDLPFGRVHELRAGEQVAVGGATVAAVRAWHPTRRFPGRDVHDALGYLVARIWFAGDTALHPEMEALRGRVDVVLVPIWGWGPTLGPGHLDPGAAARAVALVQPAVAVPIHWGTLLPLGTRRRHAAVLRAPALAFAAQVARAAPGVRVATLAVGASLDVDA